MNKHDSPLLTPHLISSLNCLRWLTISSVYIFSSIGNYQKIREKFYLASLRLLSLEVCCTQYNQVFINCIADWGPKIDIAGFCFLDLDSNYDPPVSLVKWLEEGEKPIYIGFGSIVSSSSHLSPIESIVCTFYVHISNQQKLSRRLLDYFILLLRCSASMNLKWILNKINW